MIRCHYYENISRYRSHVILGGVMISEESEEGMEFTLMLTNKQYELVICCDVSKWKLRFGMLHCCSWDVKMSNYTKTPKLLALFLSSKLSQKAIEFRPA